MRLGASLVGDLRKALAEEVRAGELAASCAVRDETETLRRELRQQTLLEGSRSPDVQLD